MSFFGFKLSNATLICGNERLPVHRINFAASGLKMLQIQV